MPTITSPTKTALRSKGISISITARKMFLLESHYTDKRDCGIPQAINLDYRSCRSITKFLPTCAICGSGECLTPRCAIGNRILDGLDKVADERAAIAGDSE
jgi:hypothetical protein